MKIKASHRNHIAGSAAIVAAVSCAMASAPAAQAANAPVLDTTYVAPEMDMGGATYGSFLGDEPLPDPIFGYGCPETRNRPRYSVTKSLYFFPDTVHPSSSWLNPNDGITLTVTHGDSFTFTVKAGAEYEAGIVLTKAKTTFGIDAAKQWSSSSTISVKDENKTSRGYRAVAGNMGYRITYKKSWVAYPCTPKTTTGSIAFPRPGDVSIARYPS